MLYKQQSFGVAFIGKDYFLRKCRTTLLLVFFSSSSRCVLGKRAGSHTPLDDVISGDSLCQNFCVMVVILTSKCHPGIGGEEC